MAKQELLATVRDRYRASVQAGRKAGFWTSSSRLPATTASMASGCWGNPVMTERSSRR